MKTSLLALLLVSLATPAWSARHRSSKSALLVDASVATDPRSILAQRATEIEKVPGIVFARYSASAGEFVVAVDKRKDSPQLEAVVQRIAGDTQIVYERTSVSLP